jgi:hypothetical protein
MMGLVVKREPFTPDRLMPCKTGRQRQAYFWTEEWQVGEREATRQAEAGEGEFFENERSLLRALDPERAKRDGI